MSKHSQQSEARTEEGDETMADLFSLGLQGAGARGGLIGGSGASTKQKQLLGAQKNLANRQIQSYDYANPLYQQALQQYGQSIGLIPGGPGGYGNAAQQYRGGSVGMHAGVAPGQTATYQNPFTPGADNGYQMGVYNQQAYRLR